MHLSHMIKTLVILTQTFMKLIRNKINFKSDDNTCKILYIQYDMINMVPIYIDAVNGRSNGNVYFE